MLWIHIPHKIGWTSSPLPQASPLCGPHAW